MTPFPRIVVFKPGPIGDVLHALPAVAALRNRFPGSRIVLVSSGALRDLLDGYPHVDERIYLPSDLFRGDLPAFLRFAREVRSLRADLFVDLRKNAKSFLLRNFSGAKTVLRYRKQRKAPKAGRRLHAVENFLEAVAPVTGTVERPDLSIRLLDRDRAAIDRFLEREVSPELRDAPRVVLNATVGWAIPSRLWPPDHFARLGDRAREELGAVVFLTGGPEDRQYVDGIAGTMRGSPVVTAGTLTLGETAALIEKADLLVSGDTGPLHMAVAVGTRAIGLYGSVSTERSRPYGEGHVALKRELPCLPCEKKVCPLGTMQCMKDLSVEEVFGEVREALERTGEGTARRGSRGTP